MFKKLVAIEPVSLIPTAEEALHQYAEQVELYLSLIHISEPTRP